MYTLQVVNKLTPSQQQMMRALEQDAFPQFGAVDEQTFVPIARYGRLLWYTSTKDERPLAVAQVIRDYEDATCAYIFGYYVRSDYQGKGLGSQFFNAVLQFLQQESFTSVVLTVDIKNEAAIRLYKKIGFKIEEERLHEFGQNEHRYFMRKKFN